MYIHVSTSQKHVFSFVMPLLSETRYLTFFTRNTHHSDKYEIRAFFPPYLHCTVSFYSCSLFVLNSNGTFPSRCSLKVTFSKIGKRGCGESHSPWRREAEAARELLLLPSCPKGSSSRLGRQRELFRELWAQRGARSRARHRQDKLIFIFISYPRPCSLRRQRAVGLGHLQGTLALSGGRCTPQAERLLL